MKTLAAVRIAANFGRACRSSYLCILLILPVLAQAQIQYDDSTGGFTIELPKIPTPYEDAYTHPSGLRLEVRGFSFERNGWTFALIYYDYPTTQNAMPDAYAILEGSRDGSARRTQSSVVYEQRTSVQGYPALDYWLQMPDSEYLVNRLVLKERRQYMMTVEFYGDTVPEEAARAIASFRLTAD